jgi:hypothetical protein
MIGIAYVTNDFNQANGGDVHCTSTDEVNMGAPTTVFGVLKPNDYIGAMRAVDIYVEILKSCFQL